MNELQKYNESDVQVTSPEGLVGWVLDLEAQADDFSAKAKALNEKAKVIRSTILSKLKTANLTSATHDSGYRASIRVTPKISVEDAVAAIKSIKKNKLGFVVEVPRQVIPAHEEINMAQLEMWLKSGTPAQRTLLTGVKVEEKEGLVIAKK